MIYEVAPELLQQVERMHVIDGDSSGEAEVGVAPHRRKVVYRTRQRPYRSQVGSGIGRQIEASVR